MNRNYYRALSSLLRQAAASADATSLPFNTKFMIPTEAACLHSAADALFTPTHAPQTQPLYEFRTASSLINDFSYSHKFYSTNQSSTATASSRREEEGQSVPQESALADRAAVQDLMARADFITASKYLQSKLPTMSTPERHRLLTKLAFTGITSEGQFFTRLSPQPLSVDATIKPTIQYLENIIPGVNLTRAVRNAPFLLIQSLPTMPQVESNRSWLTDTLGLQGSDLGKIVSSNGYVLYRPVEAMEACINYLENDIMDFSSSSSSSPRSSENISKTKSMILRNPRILALRVQKMESVVENMKKDLGLVDSQIKAVFWKFPAAFMLSPDKVERVVHWLNAQGLGSTAIAATVTRFPSILSFSIAENLEPTRRFLVEELGLGNGGVIERILQYSPDVFGRKIDTLRKHVTSMKEAGFGGEDNKEQLKSFLMASPGALRCNFSLPPYSIKLRFLQEELNKDIVPALVCNPMYVSYGMERIASRGAFLKLSGRSRVAVTSWLSATETDFATRFAGKSVDEWIEFKITWMKSPEAAKWLE